MVSLGRFSTLYRSTLFQIVIVGLVAFCEPGIWTALNNLGAGGNAKVGFVLFCLVTGGYVTLRALY
jgi:hypothetical protein